MLASSSETTDIFITTQRYFLHQTQRILCLLEDIIAFDASHNTPDIDHIFNEASFLCDRKIDLALYELAILVKSGSDAPAIEISRQKAIEEIQNSLRQYKSNFIH